MLQTLSFCSGGLHPHTHTYTHTHTQSVCLIGLSVTDCLDATGVIFWWVLVVGRKRPLCAIFTRTTRGLRRLFQTSGERQLLQLHTRACTPQTKVQACETFWSEGTEAHTQPVPPGLVLAFCLLLRVRVSVSVSVSTPAHDEQAFTITVQRRVTKPQGRLRKWRMSWMHCRTS